jgi:alpha-beta hydrolase superfamily lysophospholipase
LDRKPFYLSDKSGTLFCCLHKPQPNLKKKDCAVLICNPLGYEYILSHRSVRHLADRLANDGFTAIRFDYAGTGNSSGDDLDPNRLETWKQNIKAMITHTKAISGCSKICLIGLRMGATLAGLIANENEVSVSNLVLWNPCIYGKHYIREMKALALADDTILNDMGQNIESAGFILSPETAEQIKNIDLHSLRFPQEMSVLMLDRDDRPQYITLLKKWKHDGLHTDYLVQSGYLEMFAEPHDTIVPVHTLRAISEWLTKTVQKKTSSMGMGAENLIPPQNTSDHAVIHPLIEEYVCCFGTRKQLFGIFTTPISRTDCLMPTIVLLNAGSVHHVGPQRLYVILARALASQGFPCFRMDFEGIGDSNLDNVTHENHPYQESALQDTESALHFLSERFDASHFALTGICSGAYTAFRFGLSKTPHKIVATIPINPLTFYWEQGISLLTETKKNKAIQKLSHYKQSVYKPKQWWKLLTGKISWKSSVHSVLTQIQLWASSHYKNWMENIYPQQDSQLSADIKVYLGMNRHLSLFFSETDPGLNMILFDARNVFKKGMKEKKIALKIFQDADHTFSRTKKRDELIMSLTEHLISLTSISL